MKNPTRPDSISQDAKIRWVPGYEGTHAVTSTGRVFSYINAGQESSDLTWSDIEDIRSRYKSGELMREIAEDYSVGDTQVQRIIRRRRWAENPKENPRELAQTEVHSGHISANLRKENHFIHRLVLRAFLGECPDGMECRHLDGNPENNHVSNLVWGTRSENEMDKKCHGVSNAGERNGKSKLTEDEVVEIKRLLAETDLSQRQIGKMFGVTRSNVGFINRGESWACIEDPQPETSTQSSLPLDGS